MDPARYQQVKAVLLPALERPLAERAAYLDDVCGGDDALRREVEELLAGEAQQSFLEQSPVSLTDMTEDDDASGSRLGRIRLEQLLARGGMGDVYAGVDELLQRPVAVKLMKSELRMSAVRRSAFLAEARVLSGLRHQHICAVYDFFEDREQDVLVLELIEGRTLRDLLKAGDALDALGTASQITDALVAAHERGIAHRDLKPENVMITAGGQVKVLDFGLARSARSPGVSLEGSAKAASVTHTQIAGTPGYLSPEQARGESPTTATDLWSFGLMLGELLSGQRPYPEGASSQELIDRAGRGTATIPGGLPRAETQLLRQLLSPDPADRPSAREVRDELRRIADRSQRRLRWGTAAALLLVAALSGAKYTVDLQAERSAALAAQERAESARAQAEELAGFMLLDLYDGLRAVGKLDLLEPVALQAQRYFGELEEGQIGTGRGENALALIRMAEVLDLRGYLEESTEAYGRAMRALQPMAEQRPDDELVRYRLALATRNYGEVLRFGGDYAGSDPHARQAIAMARELTAGLEPGQGPTESPTGEERWSLLLRGLYLYADSLVRQGDTGTALALLSEAERLGVPAAAAAPVLKRDLGDIRYKRCMAYYDSQQADAVVEACRGSFAMDRALHEADPEDTKLAGNLASAYWMLGRAEELAGEFEAALATTDEGLALAAEILAAEPDDASNRNLRAVLLVSKGRILRAMARDAEAEEAFRSVLMITEPLIEDGRDHAIIHNHLIALTFLGRIEEARPYAQEVYDSGWRRPEFLELVDAFDLLPGVDLTPPGT